MAAPGKTCHIEVNGIPLCHKLGLMRTLPSDLQRCSFLTKTDAREAKRILDAHHYHREIKVVEGPCPDPR
jgi:hypothetical protein